MTKDAVPVGPSDERSEERSADAVLCIVPLHSVKPITGRQSLINSRFSRLLGDVATLLQIAEK